MPQGTGGMTAWRGERRVDQLEIQEEEQTCIHMLNA